MFLQVVLFMLLAVEAEACPIGGQTEKGKCCVFPFEYGGKKYYRCTKQNSDRSWCSTTGNYQRDYEWSYCIKGKNRVSCGDHEADTCSECPDGHGASWCNGDCSWCVQTRKCYRKGIDCLDQAKKEKKDKEEAARKEKFGELTRKVDKLVIGESDNSNEIKKILAALSKLTKSVGQISSSLAKMDKDIAKNKNLIYDLADRIPGCSKNLKLVGKGMPTEYDTLKSKYVSSLSKCCDWCNGWDGFHYQFNDKTCVCYKKAIGLDIDKEGRYVLYKYIKG